MECAPVVIPGLRRPWRAAMQLMARMRRRRRSTTGNHMAYVTVFSTPRVIPIQHIHAALGMQLLGLPWSHRAWRRCRAAMPVPAIDAPSLPHAPNVLRGVSIHDSPSAPGTVLGGPFRLESNGAIMYHGSPISRFEVALPTGERAPVAIPRPRSPWELPWATVPLGYHAIIV